MESLNLKEGQMILLRAKGVNGDKVSLEFAQLMKMPNASVGLTSLLNASDDRFTQQKPRYAWETGSKEDIKKIFNIDVSTLAAGEVLEIGMLDPTVNGQKLNIQLTETTVGTEWQVANIDKVAKRNKKDGDFILKDGKHIFVNAKIVVGEPNHVLFTPSETTRQSSLTNLDADALAAALQG